MVVEIKNKFLKFGNLKYFRAHAEQVQLGSIGEKRKSPLFKNYLEVEDRIQIPETKIIEATTADIDYNKTKKTSFNTDVSAIVKGVPVKMKGGLTFQKLKSGDLRLVKFGVMNNDLLRLANNSPAQLNALRRWGKKARIACQVFIVIEAKLAEEFVRGGNVEISAGVKGLEVKVGADHNSSGSTTVSLSKDTCFAYLLAEAEWENNVIVDLDYDQHGVG